MEEACHLCQIGSTKVKTSTYRVIPRRDGGTFDVEMTAPDTLPRFVNCFNTEADAWEWLDEQRQCERFARRLKRDPNGYGRRPESDYSSSATIIRRNSRINARSSRLSATVS